jgi:hypothetical protein
MAHDKRAIDSQERRWAREWAARERESMKRFGLRPDPIEVLRALVDAAPGPVYREFIDGRVIEAAARRVLAAHPRLLPANVVKLGISRAGVRT